MNIEVTGIQTIADENYKQIIYKLGKLIKVQEEHLNNIDVAHRLLTHTNKIPAIIVKFKSRTDRDHFFEKRFNLKDKTIEIIGFKKSSLTENQHHKIYLNESLSIFTKLLFKKYRDSCRMLKYKHCFTTGGVISVKKEKNSGKIRINHEGDLKKMKN